jgi:alpha-N-arabinofuranosidase
MHVATVSLDTQHHAGPVDPRLFSGFLEHLGRAVYEGVYDPGSPHSGRDGFRRDVLAALRAMRMPLVRYPGGNFVSCYDWRDGIGPRAKRPVRPDFAWKSQEPNAFGVDEMLAWCRKLGSAPMMAVNLGTLGAPEAAALLEYCNLPAGTAWADRRVAHGHRAPYAIRTWCLGNEMDGPWQAGHVPAGVYAQRAAAASQQMKGLDPAIETVLCGSSGNGMPTYMSWDREVLEYAWDTVDYLSVHRYSGNHAGDSAWYLAEGVEIDRILEDYDHLLGYVRALKRSRKRVFISFDEWNVWYRARGDSGGWARAPHLLEEEYNLEDALVCAQYLNSFVRRADVVKIACLAQIVNVIAPILTRRDGLLRQTIYHPFVQLASHAAGLSLRPLVDSPLYRAGARGDVPVLDLSATYDPDCGTACVFLVNRDRQRALPTTLRFADARVAGLLGAEVLAGPDLKQANTWEQPDAVHPIPATATVVRRDGTAALRLPPASLTVVRLALRRR